jgi:hypothetical protein
MEDVRAEAEEYPKEKKILASKDKYARHRNNN